MASELKPIEIAYTNYRGETSLRTITPQRVWFGSTKWHPEPQWLVTAYDHDKQAVRDFAFKDFNTRPAPAATDTGLVTVEHQYWRDQTQEWLPTGFPDRYRNDGFQVRELVTRSQAEAIIAAKNATLQDAIECVKVLTEEKNKLEADNAALVHDLNRIKDHETELVNDNAAMDARIKELETELENGGRVKGVNTQYANALAYLEMTEDDDPEEFAKRTWDERKALEAKLAAAEKALEPFADHANDRAVDDTGWRDKETVKIVVSIGDLRKARAVLGGKPS